MRKRYVVPAFIFAATAWAGLLASKRPDLVFAPLLSRGEVTAVPLVVGHRGAPLCAPENTLVAFDKAVELGADAIELDILLTGDGVPIVGHHTTIGAAAGQPAGETTLSVIRELNIKGEPVPTLEEALDHLGRHVENGALERLFLHYSHTNPRNARHAATVTELIRETGVASSALVMVPGTHVEQWIELAPDLAISANWSGPGRHHVPLDVAHQLGLRDISVYRPPGTAPLRKLILRTLVPRPGVTARGGFWPSSELVAAYQEQGFRFVAFTLNDPVLMRLHIDIGFDAIGTDDVTLLRQVIDGTPGRPRAGLCQPDPARVRRTGIDPAPGPVAGVPGGAHLHGVPLP